MKLLNKILLVFLSISMLTLYGGWRFIHSEKFSKDISKRVSNILTKKFGAQLSFNGVEFSLVPLSTSFKNVKMLRKDPALFDLELAAESLTVAFSYSSFISSELEIEELYINNGFVKLKINKESNDDFDFSKIKLVKIYSQYQNLLSQIPVRLNIISLKDLDLTIDESTVKIKDLSLSPLKRQLRLRANVENINLITEIKSKPQIRIDKVDALLFMTKDEWKIEKLIINKAANEVQANGSFTNVKDWLHFNSSGSIKGSAKELISEIPEVSEIILPINAELLGEFTTTGQLVNPDISFKFFAKNVETKWIRLQTVNGIVKKHNQIIFAEKLEAQNHLERYTLKQRQAFFDLNSLKFTDFHFKLKLVKAETNTFLYYLRDSLNVLKGNLSGEVDIKLDDEKATFLIDDKLIVGQFKLTNADGKKDILRNNGFEISKSILTVDKKFILHIDMNALMPQTSLKAKGSLGNGKIDIKVSDSKVDLKSMGPIAGVQLTGQGTTELLVSGPLEDVKFDFIVDWNNFSLIDLNFGRVASKFSLSLKELKLTIAELSGVYNQTNYSASGDLNFQGDEGMDLKVNLIKSTFADARKMFGLIFNKIKMPMVPEFNFSSNVFVKGGYDVPSLNIEGSIKGSEIKIGTEEADRLNAQFTLINNHLSFRQLRINKARGQLMANVSVALANNYIELNGAAQGIRLNDFNTYKQLGLEYDGDLFLDFDGSGTTSDFHSRFKLRLANAFIGNMPASASNALFYVNSEDVVTNASLLGGKIKLDSLLKLSTGLSETKASIDTGDIKEILGIYSGHNISEKGITGKIKADLNTQISVRGDGVRKFYLNVSELILKKGNIDLKVDPKFNKIEVDDGIVKVWDLRLKDGDEYFYSKGRNISNGVIALDQKFSIKANLFEIFSGYIDRAVGVIKGSNSLVLEKKLIIKDFTLFAENLSLKIRNLPGYFNNLQFNVIKKAEVFELNRMTGKYGEGDVKISGRVVFDDRYPQVSLDYKIDRATIPLFKKSNVLISSNGLLSGTDLPYKLNGRLLFLHAEFLDDPADFTKDGKINIDEYKKYLPQKDLSGKKAKLDINISFDIVNPLRVKNNMAEVYFKGNGQATGDVLAPELNTRLEIIPTLSKFKFKGHDFELSQGYVEIRDRGKNRLSDLKFTGVAKINDYDMKLDLSGNVAKVNVDLSSEPALSKEDLLSLLTLGVTSDMSKNLEAGERRFVTTVGIGSLLVDQLKINEDLNSSLGLKLSVQPEFKQNEATLTQGKAAVSDSSTSRLKSATKIKINKQLANKVDVSLSSTVGGSLEQKQEMNVNYNINKSFSIEGVYELKPTESEETTNTPSSLGADLKYRWSF